MSDTLFGVGIVAPDNRGSDPDDRVSRVLGRAEELLADLDANDTVFDECPPEFGAGTSDSLEAYDTVLERPSPAAAAAPVVIEDDDDLGLATLTTTPAVNTPPPPIAMPSAPVAAAPAPRRSWFAALLDTIKGWFGKPKPAPLQLPEADIDDDDGSSAWTYTVSDRRVAQAREHRNARPQGSQAWRA